MAATADGAGFARRLFEVILLVVAPLVVPLAWIGGAALLVSRQRVGKGPLLTLALCPAGLLPPLWFYGAGADLPLLAPRAAFPIAAVLMASNLVAVWRVLEK